MDGVAELRNLRDRFVLTLVPDPIFNMVDSSVELRPGDTLLLNVDLSSYQVFIHFNFKSLDLRVNT